MDQEVASLDNVVTTQSSMDDIDLTDGEEIADDKSTLEVPAHSTGPRQLEHPTLDDEDLADDEAAPEGADLAQFIGCFTAFLAEGTRKVQILEQYVARDSDTTQWHFWNGQFPSRQCPQC